MQQRNAYKFMVGNLKKKTFGRPRSRWEDDIKMYFKQARLEGVGRFYLA